MYPNTHVDGSKAKLSERSEGYVHAADGYFYCKNNNINMRSVDIFKHDDRLYKVLVRIDEINNSKNSLRESNKKKKTSLSCLIDRTIKLLE
jgi:hypothetical protein